MSVRTYPDAGQSACGGPVACTPIAYTAAIFGLSKTNLSGLEGINWKRVSENGVGIYNAIVPKDESPGWFATYSVVNNWMRKNQPAIVEHIGRREFTLPRFCQMTIVGLAHVHALEKVVPDLFSYDRAIQLGRLFTGHDVGEEFLNWMHRTSISVQHIDPNVFDPFHYESLNLFATQVLSIDGLSSQLRNVEINDSISRKRSNKRDKVVTGTMTKSGQTTAFWTNRTDYAYMDSHGSSFALHKFNGNEFDQFMRDKFCGDEPVFVTAMPSADVVDFVKQDFQDNPNLQTTAAIFKMVENY